MRSADDAYKKQTWTHQQSGPHKSISTKTLLYHEYFQALVRIYIR